MTEDFQGFDADAAAKALDAPRLRYGGEVYEGQQVSLPAAIRFIAHFQRLESGEEVDVESLLAKIEEALEAMAFAADGEPLDVEAFLEDVPAAVAKDAVLDFLASFLGGGPSRSP